MGDKNPSLFDVQKQKKEKKYSLLGSGVFFLLFGSRFKFEISLQCEPKLQESLKAQQLEPI